LEFAKKPKEAFLNGWIFGLGYFLGGCYWFYSPLMVEPGKYAWLIPFALTILPSYLGCYLGLTTLATWFCKEFVSNRFNLAVIFAAFWTIFEYARGILLFEFPWNLIGYSLSFLPLLIQTVAIFGSYIFGFIVLILYTSLYILKDKEYRLYYPLYVFLLSSMVLYGFFRLRGKENIYSSYRVRLVQPNISQREKIINDQPDEILDHMIRMSLEDTRGVDYIIWPETALPEFIPHNEYSDIVQTIGKKLENSKFLITGAIKIDRAKGRIYNSLFILSNTGVVDSYDKYHLAAFGEFVPFSRLLKFLNSLTGIENFSKSEIKNRILEVDNVFPKFAPNICYESVFSDSVGKGAELIINITNDAWLGNTSGPYQHLDALRFRALENNIPALRVANSGISGVIDRFGRIVRKTKLNTREILDVQIPLY
jgi:apolipoprotein N-acyltransferase